MRTALPFRTAALAAVAATALALTGCSFTTTAEPSSSAVSEPPATSASTPAAPAPSSTADAAAGAEQAPEDLAGLVSAFVDAGLIEQSATYPLAFEGIATDATGADDSGGGRVEFYYVDLDSASDAVRANYEMARTDGTADYGGGIIIPIDDVSGPFMIAYSAASDPAALQAEWEELTAGLE